MLRKPLQNDLDLRTKRVALREDILKRSDGEELLDTVKRRELKGKALSKQLDIDDSLVWDDVGYSAYSKEKPPCSGYWEVASALGDTMVPVKRWYNAENDKWMSGRGAYSEPFPFTENLVWRGLAAPHPNGYTYPVRNLRVKLREE